MRALWRRNKRDEAGFTLIELAIALAILGILVAIAVPTYLSVRNRAYDAEAKQHLGEIRAVAWSYYVETGSWWKDNSPIDLTYLGYENAQYSTDNWTFSIDATNTTEDTLYICADGKDRAEGRAWKLTLTSDGKAQMEGPKADDCAVNP